MDMRAIRELWFFLPIRMKDGAGAVSDSALLRRQQYKHTHTLHNVDPLASYTNYLLAHALVCFSLTFQTAPQHSTFSVAPWYLTCSFPVLPLLPPSCHLPKGL